MNDTKVCDDKYSIFKWCLLGNDYCAANKSLILTKFAIVGFEIQLNN